MAAAALVALVTALPVGATALSAFHTPRLLGFGRYWKFRSRFGCASRASGLTCWNRAGHGWVIRRRDTVTMF